MKGFIYRLFNETDNYYGSTSRTVAHRFSQHKHDYKRFQYGKTRYRSCFEVLKKGDYKIECLEEIDYDDIDELRILEKKYINENNCVNIMYKCRL